MAQASQHVRNNLPQTVIFRLAILCAFDILLWIFQHQRHRIQIYGVDGSAFPVGLQICIEWHKVRQAILGTQVFHHRIQTVDPGDRLHVGQRWRYTLGIAIIPV